MSHRKRTSSTICALILSSALSISVARAQEISVESDQVTLAMILPALAGTEIGALEVANAPLPGESSVIRASDVKAKIKASGRDTRGLAIPRSVKVVRPKRELGAKDLDGLVRTALAPQVAPCTVDQLSQLEGMTLAAGDFEVEAEPLTRKQSGRTNVVIKLRQGAREQRISAQAVLSCPPPVMMPGAQITLVVISGAVHVSAPGTASQPGRVGDEIRVTNQITKKSLKARVLNAQTAQVVP